MYGPKIENQLDGSSSGTEMRYATVQLDNINIDMIEFREPEMGTAKALPDDRGSMHLCFEVDDIQSVYDRLVAAGIEFDAPPFEFSEQNAAHAGGTKVAYFSDPDGVNLELIQPAPGSFRRG
jgi:catechol 2,3-dioxygenase-like lactoylglutathione lyase family enzyme